MARTANATLHQEPVPVDLSRDLIPVRRLHEDEYRPDSPLLARLKVLCPMVGTEVVLQRCDFCPHGKEWIHDQETDTLMLRCTYLARGASGR